MMKRLEHFLDRRKLNLNVAKSKTMVFKKGGGKEKNTSWNWKGERVEEVKEILYLGIFHISHYILHRSLVRSHFHVAFLYSLTLSQQTFICNPQTFHLHPTVTNRIVLHRA